MSRVLVVHPVRDDLSAAHQWGALTYVNDRYVYGDELSENDHIPRQFERSLALAAKNFNPDNDHLLLVGDHLQIVCLVAMISQIHGKCSVLRYDRQAAGYFRVQFRNIADVMHEQGLTDLVG